MNKKASLSVIFLLVLGFILATAPGPAHADTQYVSDKLIITMRSGAGGDYKILKTLKTGTPLQVLEESGDYFRVQTKDGTEGWVLKRYITTETPKTTVIAGLRRRIEKLKGDLEKLKSDLRFQKNDMKKLERSLNKKNGRIYKLTGQIQEMTAKYNKLVKDSGDIINIVGERDLLKKENARLSAENKALTRENERLLKRNVIYWFLAGGFVFLVGWIIGQVSRRRRRRF